MTTDKGSFSDTTTSAATDLTTPTTPVSEALATLDALAQQARQFAGTAKSEATRRAYRCDWNAFSGWCESMGLPSLPASPEVVASYVSWMVSEGRKVATIVRSLTAISQAHKMAGHESPTATAIVQETVKGVRRSLGVAQNQKAPVLPEQVRTMIDVLPDDLLGVRDRAVLLLGFSGAFRRSELVGLDVGDIEFTADGLVVTLRRSKTDQEAAGRKVGVPYVHLPYTSHPQRPINLRT